MLARVFKTVATAHQILISSYLQWQRRGMKRFDVHKCFCKTVEAFLDPILFFFLSVAVFQSGHFTEWDFEKIYSLCSLPWFLQ